MNVFKALDLIFPVVPNRTCGEVVSVTITIARNMESVGTFSMKRKAWYVNTSVNAFHMHRHLIRELSNIDVRDLSQAELRRVKRLISLAVLSAYLQNHKTGSQYHSFTIQIEQGAFLEPENRHSVSLWQSYDEGGDWREVCDTPGIDLRKLVETEVGHSV